MTAESKSSGTDTSQSGSSRVVSSERTLRRRIASNIFSQRLGPFLATALVVMVIFSAFRVGLLIGSWKYLRNSSASDAAISLFQGVRYDLAALAIILFPVALALSLSPSRWFSRKAFSRALLWYTALATTVVVVVETIGAAFFCYFADRLDSKAVHYIEYYKDVVYHVAHSYPVWLLGVIPIVCLAICYIGLRALFHRTRQPAGNRGSRPLHAVLLVGICVLCFCAAPRSAYFSSNRLLVELSRNNLSSLTKSLWSSIVDPWDESEFFQFPSDSDALAGAHDLLWQEADAASEGNEINPLWRRTETVYPGTKTLKPMRTDLNVVVIILESMAGDSVGALGGQGDSYTPNLDDICQQGLFFDRMYAVGNRTNHGLVGVLCSHPDLSGKCVLQREESIGHYYTLPAMFRDRGYRTEFFYGADPEFDNMKEFLLKGGIDKLTCQSDMEGLDKGCWGDGFQDEVVFAKAHEALSALRPDERFFGVILTLSNHDPFVVPSDCVQLQIIPESDEPEVAERKKMQNAYLYADWALGRFFQRAQQENSAYLDNTLFVIVSDHGQLADVDKTRLVDFPNFRVPCVFYSPRMDKLNLFDRGTISTVCSQADIGPTLMALLGGSYEHAFMGRDILSVKDEGFALLRDGSPIAFIHGNKGVILPPRSWARLFEVDKFSMKEIFSGGDNKEITNRLEKEMMSYYGTARTLLKKRAFARPDFIHIDLPTEIVREKTKPELNP